MKQENAPIPLQTYQDYVDLMQSLINGVMSDQLELKKANTVGALANYGLNALRSATGGKMRMNVYLQSVRSVDISGLSRDEMDRFLQGNEEVQMEVMKQIEDKGGLSTAEVRAIPLKLKPPKIDAEVISKMTGMPEQQVKDVFAGKKLIGNTHEWVARPGGNMCKTCGAEAGLLTEDDTKSSCSGVFGLE
jgi:hypothetical protein